jgi:hypothetical protein
MTADLMSELDARLSKELGLSFEMRRVADENSKDSWNEAIADASAIISTASSTRRVRPLGEAQHTAGRHSETKELQTRNLSGPRRWSTGSSGTGQPLGEPSRISWRRGPALAFVSSVCVAANELPRRSRRLKWPNSNVCSRSTPL